MSLLIKGVDMPKSCLVCPCSGNTDDGNEVWVCEASKLRQLTIEDKIERRPEWCPLDEIPPQGETGMSETNMSIGEFLSKITMRPVVLCRDCKYAYDDVGGLCCSHGVCVECIVREDFFCADGKVAYKEE